MSEETKTTTQEPKTQAPKVGRPPKGVSVKNTSQRPITLIVDKNTRETILPTETKELDKDFMAAIEKNAGAMTFFESGDLVKV